MQAKKKERPRHIHRLLTKASEYNDIAEIGEIARRYFAMNAFDGVSTIIGVIIGNMSARVESPAIVLTTSLSTCVAMGISGIWGSYLTESAERKHDLKELGRSTLTNLKKSRIGRASRFATLIISLVNGISPFLAALLVITPFFFPGLFPSIKWVYFTSLGIALVTLFSVGLFLGTVSKENLIFSGIKTMFAGIAAIIVGSMLNSN